MWITECQKSIFVECTHHHTNSKPRPCCLAKNNFDVILKSSKVSWGWSSSYNLATSTQMFSVVHCQNHLIRCYSKVVVTPATALGNFCRLTAQASREPKVVVPILPIEVIKPEHKPTSVLWANDEIDEQKNSSAFGDANEHPNCAVTWTPLIKMTSLHFWPTEISRQF